MSIKFNKVDKDVLDLMAGMSLEERVGQMFIASVDDVCDNSLYANESLYYSMQNVPIGGLIFFANNIESPDQVRSFIQNAQSYSNTGLFIAVDEEGGEVSRIASNENMGTTQFGPMLDVQNEQEAYSVGNTIGNEIGQFGFNLDLAPVADVNSNPNNPIIGNRAFSNDPQVCASLVSSCVKGFKNTNTLCCLKHFPGHGDTNEDTHLNQTSVNKSVEELRSCEWIPFQAGIDAGADFVLMAHVLLPQVSSDNLPASISPDIIQNYLKGELHYQGLIISDSLQMGAISEYYSSSDAALQAVIAGEDILLMPENLEEAYYAILNAIQDGRISQQRINESVYKIMAKKVEAGIVKLEKNE